MRQPAPSPGAWLRSGAWLERGAWLAVAALIYSLYVPLSRHLQGAEPHIPVLPVDRLLPLMPGWMFVYFALLLTGFLPVIVIADRRLFRRTAMGYLALELSAYLIFWLYPTQMTLRPEGLASDSFVRWGLRVCYLLDVPTCCLPSLHVAVAALAALCCWRADRLVGGLALLLALAVGLSTLLVKQHYLLDVLTGFVLAVAIWAVLVAPLDLTDQPRRSLRFTRWAPAALLGLYVLAVLALYLLYRVGWRPWE